MTSSRRAGQSVAEIFVTAGEDAFREFERAAVAEALAEHRGVLSLGGGAVLTAPTGPRCRVCTVVSWRFG